MNRHRATWPTRSLGVLYILGPATPLARAWQSDHLPPPPGLRLTTLPLAVPGAVNRPRETSVAIDPRHPRHLVVSFQQMFGKWNGGWGEGFHVHVASSTDGGASWTVAKNTSNPSYVFSADPSVAMDAQGHAFLAFVGFDHGRQAPYWGKGGSRNGLFVRRSLDGGRTFEPGQSALVEYPTMTDPPFEDKPYIVADVNPTSPHAGNLYVGWTRYSLENSEVVLCRSTDDGKTWSPPITISSEPGLPRGDASGALMGFHAAVGADGTLYATWSDGPNVVLAISRDGGETFEPSRRILSTTVWTLSNVGILGSVALPAVGIDPRGTPGRLLVAWGDYRYGDIDIMASTSEDGGRTWGAPVRVNDDPKHDGKDQVLSWVAVDPSDGAAYVAFYDRRGDPTNVKPTMTLARSTDGGRSFTNYAWTTTATDPAGASYGDYIGLGASNGRVYGAWTESVPRPAGAPVSAESVRTVIRIGIADFIR